jgi:hypothetical protein
MVKCWNFDFFLCISLIFPNHRKTFGLWVIAWPRDQPKFLMEQQKRLCVAYQQSWNTHLSALGEEVEAGVRKLSFSALKHFQSISDWDFSFIFV